MLDWVWKILYTIIIRICLLLSLKISRFWNHPANSHFIRRLSQLDDYSTLKIYITGNSWAIIFQNGSASRVSVQVVHWCQTPDDLRSAPLIHIQMTHQGCTVRLKTFNDAFAPNSFHNISRVFLLWSDVVSYHRIRQNHFIIVYTVTERLSISIAL